MSKRESCTSRMRVRSTIWRGVSGKGIARTSPSQHALEPVEIETRLRDACCSRGLTFQILIAGRNTRRPRFFRPLQRPVPFPTERTRFARSTSPSCNQVGSRRAAELEHHTHRGGLSIHLGGKKALGFEEILDCLRF